MQNLAQAGCVALKRFVYSREARQEQRMRLLLGGADVPGEQSQVPSPLTDSSGICLDNRQCLFQFT